MTAATISRTAYVHLAEEIVSRYPFTKANGNGLRSSRAFAIRCLRQNQTNGFRVEAMPPKGASKIISRLANLSPGPFVYKMSARSAKPKNSQSLLQADEV